MMYLIKCLATVVCLSLAFYCSSQNVVLNSQADVDAFDPSTTVIDGYLWIGNTGGDPILDWSNLSNLESVGSFTINNNDNLITIAGLSNLTSIAGDFHIYDCHNLSDLDGLSSLTTISGDFHIYDCYNFSDLSGLSNLASINGSFHIDGNYNFTHLNGLSNLTTIGGSLEVTGSSLTNIDGLSNLSSIAGDLYIFGNDDLPNLDGLSSLTSIGGYLEISENGYTSPNPLNNIDGLSNLTSVGGYLEISENTWLTNLNGLSSLTSVGGYFYIYSSWSLPNLDGLSSLTSVGGFLRIYANDNLTNLDGLSNLTFIGDYLEIGFNDILTDIDGLSNLIHIGGGVGINNNGNLLNLDGLSNLTSAVENLVIYSNPYLSDCCGIQHLLDTPSLIEGNIYITNNASGCDNEIEILEDDCGFLSMKIFNDLNQNCINDSNEIGIANREFIIQPGDIFGQTNIIGSRRLDFLPLGNYTITIDTSGTWLPTCPITQSFTVTNTSEETISFGLLSTEPCPAPDISIHMPFMRPCFENQRIHVQACNTNDATGILEDAFVVLELDPLLMPTSSLIPYTDLGDYMYQFDIGTLEPGGCVDFWMETTLNCEAELGQSLCMEANLYPAEDCVFDDIANPFPVGIDPCETEWDSSSLIVEGYCENDSVFFEIINVGSGDMTCFSPVRIYINGNVFLLDSIQLTSGEIATFAFDGEGQSWRLETDQHPLHPGNSQPNAMVEGCGGSIATFSSFVNTMYMDDADPVVDIYCGIVTGSYDPNDKTGFPLGINENNDILPNQQMEYLIRFQNTGTDTAFTVVIRDTLSPDFDIFSVQSGVASHPYEFTISDSRAMEWTFNNILLPDSTTNEPGSHGFIKFTVNQILDLPEETTLENTAHIYFDFNDPIVTNTSQHTINYFLSDFVMAIDKTLEVCNDNGTDMDPSDDTYEIMIHASSLNAGVSGTYEVSEGMNNLGTFSYETDGIITLPADGNIHILTFTDTDDNSYPIQKKFRQTSCSNNCELSIADIIIGECNDNGTSSNPSDDTYEVTISVTAINPGINNQFTVSDGMNTFGSLGYDVGGVLTLPADGNIYTLTFSDMDNSCSIESQVSQESCSITSIIEYNGKELNYSIFPNPTNNSFQINIINNTEPLNIMVYSSIGQKILKTEILENTIIHTNDWTKGIYAIAIYDKDGRILATDKILKVE